MAPRGRPLKNPPWLFLGLALFAVGVYLLAEDVPAWNVAWYDFAWYGYLLVLDAVLLRRSGTSFVAYRRRELAAMLFWSVPFWFLFEAFNLRLHNWYYVFVLRSDLAQEVIGWLAFATVLPACFFHYELVRAWGWWEHTRWPTCSIGRRVQGALLALGVASIVAPLVWPRWAYPLVWGATLWLPAVANLRAGGPSLLADLSGGDPRRLLRLLSGGLLAGGVWEGLNYWARCKWIYTVPGLESWKLFEMPVLGFLGFPILALSAFEGYAWLSRILRGGQSWQVPDDAQARAPHGGRYQWLGAVLLAAMASHAIFRGVMDGTVVSRRPLLGELPSLSVSDIAALERAGATSPERLWRMGHREGATELVAVTGVPLGHLQPAVALTALALHKGMGIAAARRLQTLGVHDLKQLADLDPGTLGRRLASLTGGRSRARLVAEAGVWVRAAQLGPGPHR